jgi:hypothetical protein
VKPALKIAVPNVNSFINVMTVTLRITVLHAIKTKIISVMMFTNGLKEEARKVHKFELFAMTVISLVYTIIVVLGMIFPDIMLAKVPETLYYPLGVFQGILLSCLWAATIAIWLED